MKHALSCLLVLGLIALGTASEAASVTIKFGHSGTKVHQYHIGAVKLAEAVEKNSGGSMKIEVFSDAQLGGERDLAEGTRLGTVDMAVLAAGSVIPLWVPEFQVIEMPFIFSDRAHAYAALDGPAGSNSTGWSRRRGSRFSGIGKWASAT